MDVDRRALVGLGVAGAWAGLASVHWFEIAEGLQPREANLTKIRDAAQRALSLDPRLVEAHIRLASYLCATGQRAAALEHHEKASAIDPDNPLVLSTMPVPVSVCRERCSPPNGLCDAPALPVARTATTPGASFS